MNNTPPPALEITTIIGCKNMCSYCPQKLLIKSYKDNVKTLTLENFKKILKNVPKEVVISFAGMSEPFLNRESSSMMKYAIEEGYVIILYTTLIGFDENDAEILSSVNFPPNIHFHRFKGIGFDENKFNLNKNLFLEKVLKKDSNYYNGEYVNDAHSRSGNLWDVESVKGKVYCKSPCKHDTFNMNEMLPNGDVYLCCMDYALKHKIGNLFETNYDDLDRQSIIDLANQEESDLICRKCVVCGMK